MTDPIAGLSSMATRQILAELSAVYRERTGRPVAVRSMGGVEAAARVRAGAAADFLVLASDAMEALEGEGSVVPGSRVPFAASGIAVAVRAGTAMPDLRDAEALKRATLAAGRIGYSTGPSGAYLRRLWKGWGLDAEASDRAVLAPPGVPVARLLAEGGVDLGFQQLSELIGMPGIAIAGPLPPEVQLTTVFTAGVLAKSARPAEARDLIAFLVSPGTAPAKERHGMTSAPPGDGSGG